MPDDEIAKKKLELWRVRCKAWDAAHKHQWREPYATRYRFAAQAYELVLDTPHDSSDAAETLLTFGSQD